MAFRGTHANTTIDSAISQLSQALSSADNEHRAAAKVVDGLMREIDNNVARAVSIIGGQDLSRAGKEAAKLHSLMIQRDEKRRNIKQTLAQFRNDHALADEKLEVSRKEDKIAQRARDDAHQAAVQRMEQLPEWMEALVQLRELEEQIEHVSARAKDAHEDLSAKAPAYRKDTLFNYLHERNYGEDDAKATSGMGRWMDSWVANLINYREQVVNYRKLMRMPQALDELVAGLRGQHQAIIQRHDNAADQAWAAWPNSAEIETAAANAKAKMDADVRAVDKLTRRVDSLDTELGAFAEGEDPYSSQINSILADLFKDGGKAAKALVAATESTEDDVILEKIKTLQAQLKQAQQKATKTWEAAHAAQAQLDKAQDFRSKFKSNRLGSSDRTFTRMTGNDLLNAIIVGKALDNVLSDMKRNSRVDTPTYSGSSSSSSSSSSSGSWGGTGGGFGGGGFKSGGGFGGGGFKTGGGF